MKRKVTFANGSSGGDGENGRKRQSFLKPGAQFDATMWSHESLESKKQSQKASCVAPIDSVANVYVTYAAIAQPFSNKKIYESDCSVVPSDPYHLLVVSMFSLLHVIYSEVAKSLRLRKFKKFTVGSFSSNLNVEPSMFIDVPLCVDEITTGALGVIRYCGNKEWRSLAWSHSFSEQLTIGHISRINSVKFPKEKKSGGDDEEEGVRTKQAVSLERQEKALLTEFLIMLRIITLTPHELMMLLICNTSILLDLYDEKPLGIIIRDNFKAIKSAQSGFAKYAKIDMVVIPGMEAAVAEDTKIMSFEQVMSVYNAAILLFDLSKECTTFFLTDDKHTHVTSAVHLLMAIYQPDLIESLDSGEEETRKAFEEYSQLTRMAMDLIPRNQDFMDRSSEIVSRVKARLDNLKSKRAENYSLTKFDLLTMDVDTGLPIEPSFRLLCNGVVCHRSACPVEPDNFFMGDLSMMSRPGKLASSLRETDNDFVEARLTFARKFHVLLKEKKCNNHSVDKEHYRRYCELSQHYTHITALLTGMRYPGIVVSDQKELDACVSRRVYRDPLQRPEVVPVVNPLFPLSHNLVMYMENYLRHGQNLSHNAPEGALLFLQGINANLTKPGEENPVTWYWGGGGGGKTWLYFLMCEFIYGDINLLSSSNTVGVRLAPTSKVMMPIIEDELSDWMKGMVWETVNGIFNHRGQDRPHSKDPEVPGLRSSTSSNVVRKALTRQNDAAMFEESKRIARVLVNRFTTSNETPDYLEASLFQRVWEKLVIDGIWDAAIAAYQDKSDNSKRAAAMFKTAVQSVFHYSTAICHAIDHCGLGSWEQNLYSRNVVLATINSILEKSETLTSLRMDEGIVRNFENLPGFNGSSTLRSGAIEAGVDQNMQELLKIIARNSVDQDMGGNDVSIVMKFAETREQIFSLFKLMRSHKPVPLIRLASGTTPLSTRIVSYIFRLVEHLSRMDSILAEVSCNVHGVSYTTTDAFAKLVPRISENYAFNPVHLMLASSTAMKYLDTVIPDVFVVLGALLADLLQTQLAEGKEPRVAGNYYVFDFFKQKRTEFNRRQINKNHKERVRAKEDADEDDMVPVPVPARVKFFLDALTRVCPNIPWQKSTVMIKLALATTWGTLSSDGKTIVPFLRHEGFLGDNTLLMISIEIGSVVDAMARAMNDVICSLTGKSALHGLTGLACFSQGIRTLQAAAFARRVHRTTDSKGVSLAPPYDKTEITVDTVFRSDPTGDDIRQVDSEFKSLTDRMQASLKLAIEEGQDESKIQELRDRVFDGLPTVDADFELNESGILGDVGMVSEQLQSSVCRIADDSMDRVKRGAASSYPSGVDSQAPESKQRRRDNDDFSAFDAVGSSSADRNHDSASSNRGRPPQSSHRNNVSSENYGAQDPDVLIDLDAVMTDLGIRAGVPPASVAVESKFHIPRLHGSDSEDSHEDESDRNRGSSADRRPRKSNGHKSSILVSPEEARRMAERDARITIDPAVTNGASSSSARYESAVFGTNGRSAFSKLTVNGHPVNNAASPSPPAVVFGGVMRGSAGVVNPFPLANASNGARQVSGSSSIGNGHGPSGVASLVRSSSGVSSSRQSAPSPLDAELAAMSTQMETLYREFMRKVNFYIHTSYTDGVFLAFVDMLENAQVSKVLLAQYREQQRAAASAKKAKHKNRNRRDRALELLNVYTTIIDSHPGVHPHFMEFCALKRLYVSEKNASDLRAFMEKFMRENNRLSLTLHTYPASRVAFVSRKGSAGLDRTVIAFSDYSKWDKVFDEPLPPLFAGNYDRLNKQLAETRSETGGRTVYSDLNIPGRPLMSYDMVTLVEQRKLKLRYGDLSIFACAHPDRIGDVMQYRHRIYSLVQFLRPVYTMNSAIVDLEKKGQLYYEVQDMISEDEVLTLVKNHSNPFLSIPIDTRVEGATLNKRRMYAVDVAENLLSMFMHFFQYMRFLCTLHGMLTPAVDYAFVLYHAHSLGILWFQRAIEIISDFVIHSETDPRALNQMVAGKLKEYIYTVIHSTHVNSRKAFLRYYGTSPTTDLNSTRLARCLGDMYISNEDLKNCIYVPLPEDIPMTPDELGAKLAFSRSVPMFMAVGKSQSPFVQPLAILNMENHLSVQFDRANGNNGDQESDDEDKPKESKKKTKAKKSAKEDEPDDGVTIGSQDTPVPDDQGDQGDQEMPDIVDEETLPDVERKSPPQKSSVSDEDEDEGDRQSMSSTISSVRKTLQQTARRLQKMIKRYPNLPDDKKQRSWKMIRKAQDKLKNQGGAPFIDDAYLTWKPAQGVDHLESTI